MGIAQGGQMQFSFDPCPGPIVQLHAPKDMASVGSCGSAYISALCSYWSVRSGAADRNALCSTVFKDLVGSIGGCLVSHREHAPMGIRHVIASQRRGNRSRSRHLICLASSLARGVWCFVVCSFCVSEQ